MNQKAEKYKRSLIEKATGAEVMFKTYLRKADISFRFQHIIQYSNNKNHFFICDFYLPDYNIIIEIDGEYHKEETQIQKDINRDNILLKKGFGIIRLSNQEVYELNYLDLKKIIGDYKRVYSKRRKQKIESLNKKGRFSIFSSYSQMLTFGKFKGKSLEWLLTNQSNYVDWLLKNNVIKISTLIK